MKLTKEHFGVTPDDVSVDLFTLTNDQGMEVKITNYGGIISAINVPDRNGTLEDIVLGHDTLEGYLQRTQYFGGLIGRYANRIAGGKFSLEGSTYSVSRNDGKNHLHGGFTGFDKVVWTPTDVSTRDELALELGYTSRDGEEGYPGNLQVQVTYVLNHQNELRLEYVATTDTATIVNLTNHSYFNLTGVGTILEHQLMIDADSFTPVGNGLIPTGEILRVTNTCMDFTRSTTIGSRIAEKDEQLIFTGGYDHNFVLRPARGLLRRAARLYDAGTGRLLEVLTTEPGLQFYSGNFLDGSIVGKGDKKLVKYSGCCLESQHFPDSPNHPNFPTTVLKPSQQYRQTTVFKFSVA